MDGSEEWIEQAVLRYLKVHPQAMDTIEGIADWWFRHHGAVDRPTLARVLRALVQRGILERIGGGQDGLYRMRPRM
jgi:DNA-binding MarR family transcriptional regulator